MNDVQVDPASSTVRAGGGALLRRRRRTRRTLRARRADRASSGDDRRRRPDARRRPRLPLAQARPEHRQPRSSAEIVLADGSVVTASADAHPDLFWADPRRRRQLRRRDVVRVPRAAGHARSSPARCCGRWSAPSEILRGYRRATCRAAPEELGGFFAFLTVPPAPPSRPSCTCARCAASSGAGTGAPDKADAAHRADARARRRCSTASAVPLPAMQSAFDGLYPKGLQWYWKADFVDELSDEAIARARRARRAAADDALHDAPVPDRRRGRTTSRTTTPRGRTARRATLGDRRRRPRPGQDARAPRLGARLLRRAAPVQAGRRLRQLHDGRRGRGPDEGDVRRRTTIAWSRSSASTTRTTCSGSTRTSRRRGTVQRRCPTAPRQGDMSCARRSCGRAEPYAST